MFHMTSNTIKHYVCCALFYNKSDNIIHHRNRPNNRFYTLITLIYVKSVCLARPLRKICGSRTPCKDTTKKWWVPSCQWRIFGNTPAFSA